MIPTVLLLGLLVGIGAVVASRRAQRLLVAAAAVLVPLAWGVLVGVGDSSVVTFGGGSVLAAANIAVGAVVGASLAWITRRSSHTGQASTR